MAVFAVVPVKRLSVSKRRLSGVLNPQERKVLTLAMLEDVLSALKSSVVQNVVVVSTDPLVYQVAVKFGVSYSSVAGGGLNADVGEATEWCVKRGAGSVLLLPADIPLLSFKDVNSIVALGIETSSVVLSPSLNGGTNALFQNPPNLIPACFGPKSFAKHVKEAHHKSLRVKFYCSVGIVADVDLAEDLKRLLDIQNSTRSRRFLEQVGFWVR